MCGCGKKKNKIQAQTDTNLVEALRKKVQVNLAQDPISVRLSSPTVIRFCNDNSNCPAGMICVNNRCK